MRKLAWFSFSFAAAVFAAVALVPARVMPLLGVASLGLGLVLYAALGVDRRRAGLIMGLGLAAGFLWCFGYDALVFSGAVELDGQELTAEAVVTDFPEVQDYRVCVDVKVEAGTRFPLKARAYVYDGSADGVRPGDRVRFSAKFSRADRVGEEDISTFTSRGTFLFARSAKNIETLESPGPGFTNFHRYLARAIREKIVEVFPSKARGFMLALLTGDRSLLEEDTAGLLAMKRAGVMHVVAISGMHVSILAGFLLTVLGRRRWAVLATLPVLAVFAAVSGFFASVVRAVVMQAFVLLAPLVMRENDSITSLTTALLLLLVLNPYAVAGVGLQLSFAATLGILTITPKINEFLTKKLPKDKTFRVKVLRGLAASVGTSLGALALTMPISVYYFGYLSLIAPVTNILVLWAIAPAFLLGAAAVAAGFVFVPMGRFIAFYPALLARFVLWAVKLAARPFFAAVYLDGLGPALWFGLTYLAVVAIFLFHIRPRRLLVVGCVSAVSLCAVFLVKDVVHSAEDRAALAVLDVGQGQSIVLNAGGQTAIIDCGSSSGEDAGEIAERYVRSLGRDRVDLLVLTHYHADHADGAEHLLAALNVHALAAPEPRFEESDLDEDILAAAGERGCEILTVDRLTTVELGPVTLTVYPPLGSETENERGLMCLLSAGDFDALITGDAPAYMERQLTALYELPDIECLVVGHHGSAGSTGEELLEAVTPELAVISVGENTYGHPTKAVLDRLSDRDITVLRTDESGTVLIEMR